MRKYLIGAFAGFLLSFAVGANAEVVNMIGKVVDGSFSITIDGKRLNNPALVIEGTSYFPVREYGEATGYDVKFDADLGITLTKKTVTDVVYVDETGTILARKIAELQKQISALNEKAVEYGEIIAPYEIVSNPMKEKDDTYYTNKKIYDEKQTELLNLRQQLEQLQKEAEQFYEKQKQQAPTK